MEKLDKNMTLKDECSHFSCKIRIGQRKRYKEKNFRAPQKIVLAKERKDVKTTNRNFYK